MKVLITLIILIYSFNVFSNEYQLGVIIGYPTGISGKVELGNNRSVAGALAYSLDKKFGFHVHADYLFENVKSFHLKEINPLEVYYGIGTFLTGIREGNNADKTGVGVRSPLGLEINVTNPNIQFFVEVALALNLIPSTDVNLNGGVGVRYKF